MSGMSQRLPGMLRTLVALTAIAIAAWSMVSVAATANDFVTYPHSCYAGCCDTCQGGLCCYDSPRDPSPDDVPAPWLPDSW